MSASRVFPLQTEGVAKAVLGADNTTLGQIRKDPLVLYGIFVEITRQIYSPSVQSTVPGSWVWRPQVVLNGAAAPDTERVGTDIWIDTAYKWEELAPDFRPAIYVSLAPLDYELLTKNSGLIGVELGESEYDFMREVKGTVSWIHLGETHGEAVMLATNTFNYLDVFSYALCGEFCLSKFAVSKFEPEQLSKKDEFRSVVTASFQFSETFTLKFEAQKLKRLVIDAGQRVSDMLGL